MQFRPLAFLLIIGSISISCAQNSAEKPTNVKFKKTTISKEFISEGVTVADVNKDGKLDILAGFVWYEAPNWTTHPFAKPVYYGAGMKEKEKKRIRRSRNHSSSRSK